MILDDKVGHALVVIRAMFVLVRKLTYEQADHRAISELLDREEYPPSLLLDEEDRTADFREQGKETVDDYSWPILVQYIDVKAGRSFRRSTVRHPSKSTQRRGHWNHMRIDFREPWAKVGQFADNLTAELQREIVSGHPLWGEKVRAVAQRIV